MELSQTRYDLSPLNLKVLQLGKDGLHLAILVCVQVVVQQTGRATGGWNWTASGITVENSRKNHAVRGQAFNLDT